MVKKSLIWQKVFNKLNKFLLISIFLSMATPLSFAVTEPSTNVATDVSIGENTVDSKSSISDEDLLNAASKMEAIITKGLEKIGIPGAILSVSRGDKPLYCKAFGKTTTPKNNPSAVDEKTLFPVSSVSKNVTAILVGALVDDGKIAFEDKVRKYYPEFFVSNEELSNEFTVQDLISHSSGFKHFSGDSLFKSGYSNEKILGIFKYLKQKPGEYRRYYGYQNIIYGIVGIVLERATGEKYEDLVKKYIFDKMDMKNSSAIRVDAEASKWGYFKYLLGRFQHDKAKVGTLTACIDLIKKTLNHKSKKIVDGHSRYAGEIIRLEHNGFYHKFPATSGISISAEDLAKWIAMLANHGTYKGKQIVSKETFEKLTSNIVEIKNIKDNDVTFVKERYPREEMHYCMGFFKTKYANNGADAHEIIYHMGGIYGATAFFVVDPSENISVGVACNMGGVAHTMFCEYMANNFLDIVYGFSGIDWVQRDIDRQAHFAKKQEEYKRSVAEKDPAPMEKAEAYTGVYTSEIYGDIKVSTEGGNLVISNGIRKAKLEHLNGSIFIMDGRDMSFSFFDSEDYISFFKDENGNINSFYISCFDENKTIFKRK